jgi:hypothetical protein
LPRFGSTPSQISRGFIINTFLIHTHIILAKFRPLTQISIYYSQRLTCLLQTDRKLTNFTHLPMC